MTKSRKKFLSGLMTGSLASAGAAITALQGDSDATTNQWIVVALSGLVLAMKDWKSALDAKKEK